MKDQLLASVHIDFVMEGGEQKLQIRAHRFNSRAQLKFDKVEIMEIKWALERMNRGNVFPFQRDESAHLEKEHIVEEPPCA